LRLLESQKDMDDDEPNAIRPSYITKSTKEELCIEYINSFLDQFSAIYMQELPKKNRKNKNINASAAPRKLPYMLAENE